MPAGMTKPWWCALGLDPDVVDDFVSACGDLRDVVADAWAWWKRPSWERRVWRLDGSQTAPHPRVIPLRTGAKVPANEQKLPFIALLDELHRLLDDDHSRVTKCKAAAFDLSHGADGHSSADLTTLALSAQRLLANYSGFATREVTAGLATLAPPRPTFSSRRPEILTKIAAAINVFQATRGRPPVGVRVSQADWDFLKWNTLSVLGIPVAVDPRLALGVILVDVD